MKSRLALLSLIIFLQSLCALRADPPSGIYWVSTETSDPNDGMVWRADLDGNNHQPLVDGLRFPRFIAIDASAHKLYWADVNAGNIVRCNLDGTLVEPVVFDFSDDVSGNNFIDDPSGLAIDEQTQNLYWADHAIDTVARTNLSTFQTVTLVQMPYNPDHSPFGMDLDFPAGHMYWVDAQHGKLRRANLNGAGLVDILTGLAVPLDLELDFEEGKVYWIQLGGGVWRADLSGANAQQITTFSEGRYLELDRLHRKLYGLEYPNGLVRSNLDGSGKEIIIPWTELHGMNGTVVFHDCNNNRIDDYDELAINDCNGNRQPDDCEPECGINGIPDECEATQACCHANGTCDFLPTDCCLLDGGVPGGPGTSCSGGPGPDQICGFAWACCTPGPGGPGDPIPFCDNWTLHFCVTQMGGIPLGPSLACKALTSDDNDDVVDLCDNCPQTANPDQNDCNADGVGDSCEPGPADGDNDADGVCNGADGCPNDPDKTQPGECGCGQLDVDSDGDSVLDCDDQCPGQPDTDIDQDAVLDCDDRCPGSPDVDSDGDGVLNCLDQCPGEPDVDSDFDTILDCADVCPGEDDLLDENANGLADCLEPGEIPTVSGWGLLMLCLLLLIAAKTRFCSSISA